MQPIRVAAEGNQADNGLVQLALFNAFFKPYFYVFVGRVAVAAVPIPSWVGKSTSLRVGRARVVHRMSLVVHVLYLFQHIKRCLGKLVGTPKHGCS